jgi:DNA-binding IclR family transcriptional regulator
MTPFYGANDPPVGDVVPDWLLGGNRKRRVLTALADAEREPGWSVRELIDDLRCGRSTVYEIVRALRTLNVLEVSVRRSRD